MLETNPNGGPLKTKKGKGCRKRILDVLALSEIITKDRKRRRRMKNCYKSDNLGS